MKLVSVAAPAGHYDNIFMHKNGNVQMKKCDNFLIFAQNIDRGYKLEPPH